MIFLYFTTLEPEQYCATAKALDGTRSVLSRQVCRVSAYCDVFTANFYKS